jgi:diguanylate cyclase (GGDEF)-like protein/PAS domain S-box-containing protein
MNDSNSAASGVAVDARLAELLPGLDALGLPACLFDAELRYYHANAAYCEYVGRVLAQLVYRSPADVFGQIPVDRRREMLHRALAGETLTLDRMTHVGPNKGRWVRAHYRPAWHQGKVTGVTVVLIDIQHLKDAEQAVAERQRELKLITENAGVPMAYIDADLRFRYTNTPDLDWAPGVTTENVVGRHVNDVYPAEIVDRVRAPFERALTGKKVVYERQRRTAGGSMHWIRVSLVPDRAEDGTVRGLYSMVLDVDEDHRLHDELERQERQLRFYADNIPEAIAYVAADFRFQFVNKVFERIRGQGASQILGRSVPDVLGPEAAEDFEPFVERLQRGVACSYERRIGPPSGDKRWFLVRLQPLMTREGRFNGYYIVGSDIHDIRTAQEQLQAQEAQIRLYTDNIPVSVAYLDTSCRYVFVNKTFADVRGTTREEVIGRTIEEVLGRQVSDLLAPTIARVLAGEHMTYEREMVLPSGEKRWIHGRAVPDRAPDGTVRGLYVVGHDVHDLKVAQEMLRAREEELRFFAENIPEAIVYIDLVRGCTFVNNIFLATRGFTREFALGKFPRDVYPPELMESLQPYLDRVVRGEPMLYERRVRIATTGEDRWMRVKLTPRKDASGRVQGYYVVSNDVHDLKTAQASLEEKERELREVIDSMPTPMVYMDAGSHYRYVNDAFLAYCGLPAEQVVGRTVAEVLGEERAAILASATERVCAGEAVSFERLFEYPDGHSRWMNVRYTPRLDATGRFLGYYATTSDIHEQKSIEEELRRTNVALSAHFDNTPLAVIEWDRDMRVSRWSGQAEAVFGWSAQEALGRSLAAWRLVFEDDAGAVDRMVDRLFEGAGTHATILNRNYRKDGSVIWVEWHNSALRDDAGRVISLLWLAQDVSSRIQAEERLQFMATHDGLTGLPNRVLLTERLKSAIARGQRFQRSVAVMFLDLDHFKDVNDSFGHRVGDELLKDLARRIRATLRQSDLLVRISGDEFVIVLEDLADGEGPERVAQKILDDVMRPFRIEDNEVQVSASLGFAMFPDDGEDPDTLLRNADAAMYHAKELGRNSFRSFSRSLAVRRDQRLHIETSLRRAIREGELILYYQPIVSLDDAAIRNVEALVRWNDPERGLVPPNAFIPLADEGGLARDLGRWVLDAACRQASAWRRAQVGTLAISVNLSASQLRDATIFADVQQVLSDTGCDPGWLTLEITETSMVRDLEGVSLTLGKLRRLGLKVAIDDFGTGFSSLSHLRHIPVDMLKIDKSFVADIGAPGRGQGGGAAIVSAVIGLARGLGLGVVAEGVEREEQLAFLRVQGCASYQGFLACPPVQAGEFEQWLRSRERSAPPRRRKASAPRTAAGKALGKRKTAK